MPDIRYVCLSDLHLGEEDSLLTHLSGEEIDPFQPGPVMRRLVDCLRHLIAGNREAPKPSLVLNGDILEMALAHDNEAAMIFQRFIELIMPEGDELFEKIIFIPGNHDHHLWELAREKQYVNHITAHLEPGSRLPVPWHATHLFTTPEHQPVPSYFLSSLVRCCAGVRDFPILTAYPNFGLLSEDGGRCVVFHHGHFIESIFHFMSALMNLFFPGRKSPKQVWDIEAENFAWIDFFGSMLGRSGGVGQDVEIVYEKMQNPGQFDRLLRTLSRSIRKRYGFRHYLASFVLRHYLRRKIPGVERLKADTLLSGGAGKGLRAYIEGPLQEQILRERDGAMPDRTAFLFGHTHKPFQKLTTCRGYAGPVHCCNSGGWIVESETVQRLHGGSVILIDERLEVQSIRMFNERPDREEDRVRIESSADPDGKGSPFLVKLEGLVDPERDPWRAFSEEAARAVRERIVQLCRRIRD